MTTEDHGTRTFPGWVEALAIGVASRAFSIVLLVAAWKLRLPASPYAPYATPFVIWDGQWYTFIASYGYHADAVVKTQYGPGLHDFAFFPAWPVILRVLSLGNALPLDVVAPLAANLLFLVAAIPIYSILERVGGRTIARWGLALFAFSPAAYVYSLAYSEPLFLVLAAWFFVAVEKRFDGRATILALATQLVRITGASLAFASLPDLLRRETRRRGLLIIGACVVAFAGWWLWIATLTGNFWGYTLGTPSWFLNQRPTAVPTGIASFFEPAVPSWVDALVLGMLALLALGTRWVAQRGETRLALFSIACLASTMLDTQTTMPRLMAIAFPAFGGLAAFLPTARWRWLGLAVCAGGQVLLASNAVQRLLVP